jgi:hypothetical protein
LAGEDSGKVAGTIRVETDLGTAHVELFAYVAEAAKPQTSGEEE